MDAKSTSRLVSDVIICRGLMEVIGDVSSRTDNTDIKTALYDAILALEIAVNLQRESLPKETRERLGAWRNE